MQEAPPITILAVDDEPGVLALVRRCLHDDARVTLNEASSGSDALEQVANRPIPDLLITDLRMPEMTGDELARQLRTREPKLRVLYLTSHADRLFEVKPQLWTDEAYLDKPFTRDGLREAIALLLFNRTAL
jgi:two-component system cell cycle sensor histidine kinase/response regulator CckA